MLGHLGVRNRTHQLDVLRKEIRHFRVAFQPADHAECRFPLQSSGRFDEVWAAFTETDTADSQHAQRSRVTFPRLALESLIDAITDHDATTPGPPAGRDAVSNKIRSTYDGIGEMPLGFLPLTQDLEVLPGFDRSLPTRE